VANSAWAAAIVMLGLAVFSIIQRRRARSLDPSRA
jgi:hypothetical protein